MRVQSWRSMFTGVCLIAGCVAWPADLNARRDRDLAGLDRQITELHDAGKYAEELPLVQRLVALNKARYGTVSPQHANALERLARNYVSQSRQFDAEPIYLQVIAIRTELLGSHHEDVLSTTVTLASLYRFTGRPQLGEPLLKKAIAALAMFASFYQVPSTAVADGLDSLPPEQRALGRFRRKSGKEHRDFFGWHWAGRRSASGPRHQRL